jgi:hypothetical protein
MKKVLKPFSRNAAALCGFFIMFLSADNVISPPNRLKAAAQNSSVLFAETMLDTWTNSKPRLLKDAFSIGASAAGMSQGYLYDLHAAFA